MLLTILSGLFGGLLRLAPELLKFLDAKNDRQHELDMQDKALAFQQLTGTQRIEEIQAQGAIDTQKAQFDAYAQAFTSQAQMAQAGGGFSSFLSAMVRPIVTFFVFFLWAAQKVCVMIYAWQLTGNVVQVLMNNWSGEDVSMTTMILAFWFCGRCIEKNNGQA